jgi:hypothetical protein
MAKKSSGKGGNATKTKSEGGMSADDHRKLSETHYAKARLHSAHADLKDAKNPPKKSTRAVGGY